MISRMLLVWPRCVCWEYAEAQHRSTATSPMVDFSTAVSSGYYGSTGRLEDRCSCDRGTSAARQFGEEIPDRDGRIQVLACERHGVPAVLHRIQDDHGGTIFHKGHALDRGRPAF